MLNGVKPLIGISFGVRGKNRAGIKQRPPLISRYRIAFRKAADVHVRMTLIAFKAKITSVCYIIFPLTFIKKRIQCNRFSGRLLPERYELKNIFDT